jgi:hypothetical protein
LDDFVVGFAVGLFGILVDVDEREESVKAEEDENGVRIVVGHHSRNDRWNQRRSSQRQPMRHVGNHGFARGNDLRRVRPNRGNEGSSVNRHVKAHNHFGREHFLEVHRSRKGQIEGRENGDGKEEQSPFPEVILDPNESDNNEEKLHQINVERTVFS